MEHPFKVGKSYRNRKGEYEVVSLDGPRMVLRYTDGTLLQTKVDVQARIWRNIQADAQVERERQRAESRTSLKRRGGRRGARHQTECSHLLRGGGYPARTLVEHRITM